MPNSSFEQFRLIADPAIDIAHEVLENNFLSGVFDHEAGHDIVRIGYDDSIDLFFCKSELARRLNNIGWQFITSNSRIYYRGALVPTFSMARFRFRTLKECYHVTKTWKIPLILGHGLLTSNSERCSTGFPDTDGTIHVCDRLGIARFDGGSAFWWMDVLQKHDQFGEPNRGIIRVNLEGLDQIRIYDDFHSDTGFVIDGCNRIDPDRITVAWCPLSAMGSFCL